MHAQIQILNNFKTGREKNLQSYFGKSLIKNSILSLSTNSVPSEAPIAGAKMEAAQNAGLKSCFL